MTKWQHITANVKVNSHQSVHVATAIVVGRIIGHRCFQLVFQFL